MKLLIMRARNQE